MAPAALIPALRRLAAMVLVVAVAVLPLMHTGEAGAATAGSDAVEACCLDGCCMSDSMAQAEDCCAGDSDAPASPCDDRPCDCPCCGKVIPAVSMMSPLPVSGLFWDPMPTPSWTPHDRRPESAVVGVAIQPPIV